MLQDLINPKNYNNYNIKIAQLWGLDCAVYLSTILSFIEDKKESIKVDRNRIKELTTLTKDQQMQLDSRLIDLNIITKKTDNIKINFDVLFSMFNTTNIEITKEIAPVVTKKRTKQDILKEEFKSYIHTDNPELRDAYAAWIDGVFARQGWMSKKSVEMGQQKIDSYSNRNLDLAINILNIASIGGYRDINWAINEYEKKEKEKINRKSFNLTPSLNISNKSLELSNDIF